MGLRCGLGNDFLQQDVGVAPHDGICFWYQNLRCCRNVAAVRYGFGSA
jgi:hypothetical protein